ncbi:MAG: decaprenyl-phosphate phosphoribosyltransferase [Gemmatimonadetes bacterium]|nr:decaprenyl-phosphate phosphoribosyltransferase [Gemmatimonadota bacterium]
MATSAPLARSAVLAAWIRLLRPQQWVKNAFVLTPLVFSGKFLQGEAVEQALAAFCAFCLVASGVYAGNDVVDRHADRAHPVKRNRPVAAGIIPVGGALAMALSAVVLALAIGVAVHPALAGIIAAYLGLNVLYTLWLKHMVLLDVFTIAAFFVLRLLAGATAIAVAPSIWLLLCGGLLALYLGFAKRRHELVLLGTQSSEHRSVLSEYSPMFLDQMSTVLLAVTVVSYIMYTVSQEKLAEVGSYALTGSTVFVLYGVFRYLYLVHQRQGGSPTETLLTDRSLMVAVVLWFAYCGMVIYLPF